MTEVLFYHLQNMSLESVLPPLLEKSLERGWRVVVQSTSQERTEALDAHLWTYRDDSFLPHATWRAGDAPDQPIVLAVEDGNPNRANVRFLIDNAPLPADSDVYERVVLVFNRDDGDALAAAPGAWTDCKLLALLALAPLMAGCSGATEMFQSDLLSKDAEWFSRSGRLFIRSVSIETPPLTPNKPVTAEDLVSADGGCPGMAPPGGPADANALTDGTAGATTPSTTGTVALGHAECDVVRGIGAPDSVNLSNNARGDRVAVVNYSR